MPNEPTVRVERPGSDGSVPEPVPASATPEPTVVVPRVVEPAVPEARVADDHFDAAEAAYLARRQQADSSRGVAPDPAGGVSRGDMIPARAARPRSATTSDAAPPAPPLPPQERPARTPQPRPRRPRRHRAWRIIGWTVSLLVALVLVWTVALGWAGWSSWKAVKHVAWAPKSQIAAQPGHTYLIVGSDSRAGLTQAQLDEFHAVDAEGERTDTIKLLHYGPGGPATLITVPRDSLVPIPGHGTNKINAAYSFGGPQLLVQTLETVTGLHIDGYLETGMGGLVNAVDAVGGITICPTTDITDTEYSGLVIKKGCQQVNGLTALAFSRTRYTLQLGDLQRGMDQNQVISEVMKKAMTPATLVNPFKVRTMGRAMGSALNVGDGMGAKDLLTVFKQLHAATGAGGHSCMVPLADMDVHWDKPRALQFFHYVSTDTTANMPAALCTADGFPSAAAK